MIDKKLVFGIDFDGTCVSHAFPEVGIDIGAVPILKKLVDNGHKLILWTMRSNKKGISRVTNTITEGGLQDALAWFEDNGIPLFGIQVNPGQEDWTESPKAYCHVYIDDAALGCPLKYEPAISHRPFVDWVFVDLELKRRGFYD